MSLSRCWSVSRRCMKKEWVTLFNVFLSSSQQKYVEEEDNSKVVQNVGIMAHIDAGKTTTTEHMLYSAGVTSRVGNVDNGNTVMDYLPPERERGITISSAAISFSWAGHTLNLVDTPGHADFTYEVERTLPVLDGAVTVLDACSGVEAQTLAVWRQAKQYHIPCIAFVNKMDRPSADLHKTVQSVREKLGIQPLLTQLPLGLGRDFKGVVDLVYGHTLVWPQDSDGTEYSLVPVSDLPQDTQREVSHYQDQLIEQVAMADDRLAAVLLEGDEGRVEPTDLVQGIRKMCVSCAAVPVVCGSALRGVAIQPLMDSIVAYLPTASELPLEIPAMAHSLCAYAFKQVYDVHRGLLVYLRVFSGTLKPHTSIYNASRHCREKVTRLLSAQADQLQEVKTVHKGSIAVAVGLKHTFTGDTLVRSEAVARAEGVASLLQPPSLPPPVFLCSVEPSSAANQKALEHALQCLTREDPSLRVTSDPDSGQTVLSGMGELHLEIVEERLRRVYGVACELGQLQVAYREGLSHESSASVTLEYTLNSLRHSVLAMVTLTPSKGVEVTFDPHVKLGVEERGAVVMAVENSVGRGPLLGFPVQDVNVCVKELRVSEGAPLPALCGCLSQAVLKALKEADMSILEPLTDLEVSVPEEYVGAVLSDLSSARRAQVKGVTESEDRERVVTATVPLATLLGYASELRSLTSGTATFTMIFSDYSPMDSHQQKKITEQLRGYC